MNIHEISFYDDFKCIGTDCPETCCMGWFIPLYDEDIHRLKKARGMLGLRLLVATGGWTRSHFNEDCRYCPFLNRENLCHLQLQRGHSFLPEVCREYPRFYRNYGPFEERYLDLSCPVVAGIFYENHRNLLIRLYEDEPLAGCYITNDDMPLLNRILKIRQEFLDALFAVTDYPSLQKTLTDLDSYAKMLQQACLQDDASLQTAASFPDFRNSPENRAAEDSPSDDFTASVFPFRISVYNRLITSSFYHARLEFTNPTLYSLCRLYVDDFQVPLSSQEGWAKLANAYFLDHPENAVLYASYLSYYLFQYFLRTYETYSFVKSIRTGIIHTNMVFLFHVLFAQKNLRLEKDDITRIIAVYNRRAYFSESILEDMYKSLS